MRIFAVLDEPPTQTLHSNNAVLISCLLSDLVQIAAQYTLKISDFKTRYKPEIAFKRKYIDIH